MKPLYVSATKQDTGKTTVMIGLLRAARDLGHDVGYIKPVGQRYVQYEGLNVDEDAVLARQAFGLKDSPGDMSPIAIERGFTEHYIFNRDVAPLEARIHKAFARIRDAHEYVMVEGTGHAGVGSCFDLSNARVAELLGAAVIIVSSGGIGRAIDEAALSYHLFRQHGVEVLGVIMNKAWPEKLEKVRRAVSKGLENLGTRLLGAIPYRPQLGQPRMDQIVEELDGRVLTGREHLTNIIEHNVVAAMAPEHICPFMRGNTLVVTPGDRIDTILTSVLVCPTQHGATGRVGGLALTGGFVPGEPILKELEGAGVPTVLCQEDTYTVATKLRDLVFKLRPQDTEKIAAAQQLVIEHTDVPAIMRGLGR